MCASCVFKDENKSSICIRNCSDNESLVITNVYAKEKDGYGYERIWTGTLSDGSSEFISVEEGSYSVMIDVAYTSVFGLCRSYATGYSVFRKAESGGALYVCFDGNGIYFD